MPTPVSITSLDDSSAASRDSYSYHRIVDIAGRTVRARIERGDYDFQSCAVAEVLADDLRWTHLLSEHPGNWWAATPRPSHAVHAATELGELAERLVRRAAEVLAPQHRTAARRDDQPSAMDATGRVGHNYGSGRVVMSYAGRGVRLDILDTGNDYELRWTNGVSDIAEPYGALSWAVARFGVLTFCAEVDWAPYLPDDPNAFAAKADAFHKDAIDMTGSQ